MKKFPQVQKVMMADIPTSIQHHVWLDVTCRQCREELGEQASESIIVPTVLLVQTLSEVQAEIETAAVNDQPTVPEPHILEQVSLLLHEGGQTVDTHWISGPG